MNDELDDLLTPTPQPADARLVHSLLDQTSKLVRAKKHTPRLVFVMALAGCYAAGMLTVWLLRSPPVEPEPRIIEVVRIERVPIEAKSEPLQMVTGAEMELKAEESNDAESFRRFREAGDQYLLVEKNYEAALRCYRNYLDLAPRKELVVSAEQDSWLLINLKTSRKKDDDNANQDG